MSAYNECLECKSIRTTRFYGASVDAIRDHVRPNEDCFRREHHKKRYLWHDNDVMLELVSHNDDVDVH